MFKLRNCLPVILLILIFGCKKYPEDTVWFKDPQKLFKGGKITSFTMSSIDQMQPIRDLYANFPYNYYGTPVPDVFQLPFTYDENSQTISTDYGTGVFKFSKNKKEIEINFIPKNSDVGAQNIFIQDLNWKILKLTTSGQLKIQADCNLRVYEIQFN